MKKMLTVVIPVYNDEKNIIRCLDSLFNQTFSGVEIIVVNDASTDSTLDVLLHYQQDHGFTIINMQQNSGAARCRNIGIQKAVTPYITFVDSDDWIDISTYTKCFEEIYENPDVIIYGLVYDYVMQNHRDEKYHYPTNYKMTGEFALNIYAHTIPNEIKISPIVNNKIYRRQFLVDNNLLFHEELRYQEDDAFTFEVLAKATKVFIISGCSYHYCQREDSLIHTVSDQSIYSFVNAYLSLKTYLEANDLFESYQKAFYLKLKSSLLGVIKRVIDYEPIVSKRNRLICLLLNLLLNHFDIPEFLVTFDFSKIRRIL